MPAHRTQNSRQLRVETVLPTEAPPVDIISPTPRAFIFPNVESRNSNPDVSPYSPTSHASHSLPNLFVFDPFSSNGTESSGTDAQSSTGSQSSIFSPYDSPSSYTGSILGDSHCGSSSHGTSPPDSSSTPPLSQSPSPRSVDDCHRSPSSPAPYPFPLPPHSNGQVRTQPPRPPNPWICFRNVRSAQYKSTGEFPHIDKGRGLLSMPSSPKAGPIGLDGEARRPRQADLSKHISLEWKALTEEEKAPYVRMSEEAKIIHASVYPGYKYQPRRKYESTKSAKKGTKGKKSTKKGSKSARKTDMGVGRGGSAAGAPGGGAVALAAPDQGVNMTPPQPQYVSDGDPAKEWTWLPEQTLLPLEWEDNQDPIIAMDEVMHQLDPNSNERVENGEDVFHEPIFLSFPPLDEAEAIAPFYSFPDLEENTTSADANFHFPIPSTLGLQDGVIESDREVSQSLEPIGPTAFEVGLRRDSMANPFPDVPAELTEGSPGPELEYPDGSSDHEASPVRARSSMQDLLSSLPHFSARAALSARRGSVPTYTHVTAPNEALRAGHRTSSEERPRRRSSVTGVTLSSLTANDDHELRSVPTSDFNSSSGITTSILIPKKLPGPPPLRGEEDLELERDLADYGLALDALEMRRRSPSPAVSPMMDKCLSLSPAGSGLYSGAGMELSLPWLDFEAEFGDIIDIDERSS